MKEAASEPAKAPRGADAATRAAYDARNLAQAKNDIAHQRLPVGAERFDDACEVGARPQFKAAPPSVTSPHAFG